MRNPLVREIFAGDWFITERGRSELLPAVQSILRGDHIGGAMAEEPAENIINALAGRSGLVEFHPLYGRFQIDAVSAGTTAIVPIVGPIMKYGYWSAGTANIKRTLLALAASPKIDKIVLEIDSGGGTVAGTRELADAIMAIDKPTYAYVSDMAASAALWIAAACDTIYSNNDMAEVGSIGVYTSVADFNAYYASQGLPVHDIYSKLSSEKNADYKSAIAGDDKPMIKRLDRLAAEFIMHIKDNRPNLKITQDNNPTKGRMYYADEALEIGLIDGIGTMEEMLGLSPKSQSSQTSQTNTNMKLHERIASFFGAKKAGISAEDITACNTQLATDKAGVFVVAATDEIPDHATLQAGMDASGVEIDRLSGELDTATASLTAANTAKDTAVADAKAKGDKLTTLTALFGDAAKAEGFDLAVAVAAAVDDANKFHNEPAGGGAEGTEARTIADAGGATEVNVNEMAHNKYADAIGFAPKSIEK